MNREILFRGKRFDNEEWVYGYYVRNDKALWKHVVFCIKYLNFFEVIPETVGQFTGLTDKNGTKIFEGDMVQIKSYGECIITFNTSICSFQYAYYAIGEGTAIGGRMSNTLFNSDTHRYEITSNIHDNPTT